MIAARALSVLAAILSASLSGCGQKGPLYLPDSSGEVVTRPTQTPAQTTTGPESQTPSNNAPDDTAKATSPPPAAAPPPPATPPPQR